MKNQEIYEAVRVKIRKRSEQSESECVNCRLCDEGVDDLAKTIAEAVPDVDEMMKNLVPALMYYVNNGYIKLPKGFEVENLAHSIIGDIGFHDKLLTNLKGKK